jgi:hypothetical protein
VREWLRGSRDSERSGSNGEDIKSNIRGSRRVISRYRCRRGNRVSGGRSWRTRRHGRMGYHRAHLVVALSASMLLGGCWLDFGEPPSTVVENATDETIEIYFDRPGEEVLFRELEAGGLTALSAECNDEPMVARSQDGEEIDQIAEGEVCQGQVWRIGD